MRRTIVMTIVLDDDDIDNDGCPEPTPEEISAELVTALDDTEFGIPTGNGGSEYLYTPSCEIVTVDGETVYDARVTPYVARDMSYLPQHSRVDA